LRRLNAYNNEDKDNLKSINFLAQNLSQEKNNIHSLIFAEKNLKLFHFFISPKIILNMSSLLITIEGIDGSGKTTLINNLKKNAELNLITHNWRDTELGQ